MADRVRCQCANPDHDHAQIIADEIRPWQENVTVGVQTDRSKR